MIRPTARHVKQERGQFLVIGAIALTALLGLLGLIVDAGFFYSQRRQTQNAADAAAQAAAEALHEGATSAVAVAAAREYAAGNGYGNDGVHNTVTVNIPPTTGPHAGDAHFAEVIINEHPKTFFIQVVLPGEKSVKSRGVAGFVTRPPCGLCALSLHAPQALNLSNNANVTITNGGVVVNSDQNNAASLTNNASITATSIGVVGNTQGSNNASFHPTPVRGISPIPDPLGAVPVPTVAGANQGAVIVTNNNARTISPGVYTTLRADNNGRLTLNPGIYVVTGMLDINNHGLLSGSGVMIYFACAAYPTPCNTGQAGGRLSLSNNGQYHLTAPASGTYQGLAILYDPKNTATVTMENNAGDNLTGTLYAASSNLNLSNNAGVGQFNSLVVVSTATLSNNGSVNIVFNESENYQLWSAASLFE